MQENDKNLPESEKEERVYKGLHSFWRRGTACIFDVRITDLDTASNRETTPDKILEKKEKENKNKYQEN